MAGMGRARNLALAIGAFGAALVAASTMAATGAASREYRWTEKIGQGTFADRLLAAHNEERRRVGVPALRWSAKLAGEARQYAEVLAQKQRLEHASRDVRQGAGENLWAGRAGFYSAEEMIGTMVDEKRHFIPGQFPRVSNSGQWRDVGHYTQLIWRETQEVGCAITPGGGQDWLVCRYWPAGNVVGRPVL